MSPLLFNIMMKDFPISNTVQNYIFADDITIVCTHKDPNMLKQNLQSHLNLIAKWTNKWGFKINTNKTKFQHFTYKSISPPLLTLCNSPILYIKEQRLLGVVFDSPRLTWGGHIKSLYVDCTRRLNIMKTFSSINYGASFSNLRMFYTGYIRPKLSYGAAAYSSACKTGIQKLSTIQNSCLRLMLGARRSSPILLDGSRG